ncbi:hypothetical protein F5884DRAFT_813708 [Xylogone sp. PMI_703]|nr:hypothetical protein F5884DRAFT_813708 [Xylogone sp. PMI_703]
MYSMELVLLLIGIITTRISAFAPENSSVTAWEENLPISYTLVGSQTLDPTLNSNSFWSSSFLSGSDGHDYLVLSHGLFRNTEIGVYRASILDITEPSSFYKQFEILANTPRVFYENTGVFNFSFDNWGFGSISATDPLSTLRTWSSVQEVEFDITFDTAGPVLYNGGTGSFQWGSGPNLTNEWSMPAGRTSGHITNANGEKVSIDASRSITWYDRQWSGQNPTNWTWFQIHLGDSPASEGPPASIDLSIWIWDDPEEGRQAWATGREAAKVQYVVPVVEFSPSQRYYSSSTSGAVYPLDWTISLLDGRTFWISSVRPDQELVTMDGQGATYEGYIEVNSVKDGSNTTGYGVVEIVPVIS